MRVLGVIPARGGSKGIPRKNLAEVGGRCLIDYTIESAKASHRLTDLVASTDDEELAERCRQLEVEIPFMRPAELAQDKTPTIDVLVHLIQWMIDNGRNYDAICLLQPTSPQRSATLIDDCIERFQRGGKDSLVTVSPVPHQFNPHWVYWKGSDGSLELSSGGVEPIYRRQELPKAFIRDGRIYLSKTDIVTNKRSLFGQSVEGYELPPGVNIDTPSDLEAFAAELQS